MQRAYRSVTVANVANTFVHGRVASLLTALAVVCYFWLHVVLNNYLFMQLCNEFRVIARKRLTPTAESF